MILILHLQQQSLTFNIQLHTYKHPQYLSPFGHFPYFWIVVGWPEKKSNHLPERRQSLGTSFRVIGLWAEAFSLGVRFWDGGAATCHQDCCLHINPWTRYKELLQVVHHSLEYYSDNIFAHTLQNCLKVDQKATVQSEHVSALAAEMIRKERRRLVNLHIMSAPDLPA